MSDIVVLNVGGQKFFTTKETLKSSVCRENTFFTNLSDSQGEIFIDRDPSVFMYILNYLRDGKVAIPEDQFARTRICQEAEGYSSLRKASWRGRGKSCRWLHPGIVSQTRHTSAPAQLHFPVLHSYVLNEEIHFCMDKLATMIDFAATGRHVVIEAIKWDPTLHD
ncbi:hypothetical protein Y032_0060g3130 [Ancylostoma ceylanicum]|uniref:BTB domain-containing protein n=1 Tax=Ancylostoma ceylanicum TaxID=53326 RepID=A0A016U4B6_9BILA|nr:hypothetical protein Y032_0060g3130 [Ancylostoma ceylanicum]